MKEQWEVKGFSLNTIFFAEHPKIVANLVRPSGKGSFRLRKYVLYDSCTGSNPWAQKFIKKKRRGRKGEEKKKVMLLSMVNYLQIILTNSYFLFVYSILLPTITCVATAFREMDERDTLKKVCPLIVCAN